MRWRTPSAKAYDQEGPGFITQGVGGVQSLTTRSALTPISFYIHCSRTCRDRSVKGNLDNVSRVFHGMFATKATGNDGQVVVALHITVLIPVFDTEI